MAERIPGGRVLAGRSIALRLAVSSLFWSCLILLIAGIILTTLYRRTSENSFDQRLLVYANDLAADLVATGETEGRERPSLGDPRFAIPLSGWYWQVGRIDAPPRDIKASRSLLGNSLPTLGGEGPSRRFGLIRKDYVGGPENRQLRMVERDIDLGEDGRFIVRVAGPADEMTADQARFVAALVLTFLMLGVALGLTTLLQIRFGLKPLLDLRSAVGAIRRGESERISGAYPHDVAPLAEELNLLLEANREILERARTQVGNLAHALKTPLSVMINEADRLDHEVSGKSGLEASGAVSGELAGKLADRVREQTAIMRQQVDYYLNRARAAALAGTLGIATEVEPILDALARTFAKIYLERDLTITVACEPDLRFLGERQDLEEMAGNLIDNACKWAAGRVEIRAERRTRDGRPLLCVIIEDDGPGLPSAARAEVVTRGRRLDETKPGSGLGLSIVSDLAVDYKGRLTLGSAEIGGLRAELEIGAAPD